MDIQIIASGSAGNCYRVGNILIDPGIRIKEIKKGLNYRLSEIAGCLLSHSHGDHAKAAKDIMKASIDIYCAPETAQELSLEGHRLHIVPPRVPFTVAKWRILPLELKHDVENYGYLIQSGKEKILYACDTNYIPHRFRGLTRIIIGVNYDYGIMMKNIDTGRAEPSVIKRSLKNHMSIKTAEGFFRANDLSKLKEVYLIHLSDSNSNAEDFKRRIQAVTGVSVIVG